MIFGYPMSTVSADGYPMTTTTLLNGGWSPPAAVASPSDFNFGQLGIGLQAIGALTGAVGSFYSAKSTISSLEFQASMAEINSRMAERGAQSVLDAGQRQVGALTLKAGQLKSAQRTAMAANGIDLGVGNAAEVQASTDIMKEIDKNTLEANAIRSAWGYRTQAVSMENEAIVKRGTAGQISPFTNAASSLLSNAGAVAGNWYMLNKGYGVGVTRGIN